MSESEIAVSPRRRNWLRQKRRENTAVALSKLVLFAVLVLLWEAFARFGVIDPFITSSPSRLCASLARLSASGELWRHLVVTASEACAGFILATVLGMALAVLLWCSPFLCRVLEPYLVVLNALPKIALGPVFIVWLGAGRKAVIVITVSVSVVVAALEILGGFIATDSEKLLLADTFGATRAQKLRLVILPANVPTILSSLKVSVGMAWVGVIVGEFLISREGLGYLIVYGSQVFRLDLVMASVAVLAVSAAAMYFGVSRIESLYLRKRGL